LALSTLTRLLSERDKKDLSLARQSEELLLQIGTLIARSPLAKELTRGSRIEYAADALPLRSLDHLQLKMQLADKYLVIPIALIRHLTCIRPSRYHQSRGFRSDDDDDDNDGSEDDNGWSRLSVVVVPWFHLFSFPNRRHTFGQ
jgi:hypothetical protein